MLIYLVSEVLGPSNSNYSEMEKMLYAILLASWKLQHYFQSYNIVVPSSQPLKDIIRNREATGRIGKWVDELKVIYRSSIQSHALEDFIIDWTPCSQDEASIIEEAIWTVFCDGSWGSFGAGAASVIISPSKVKNSYATNLEFQWTNNVVEYEALMLRLGILKPWV